MINQRQHLPSTDNFSDSSGDTTTADSGRGGSDLDLSHPQRQGKTLSDIQITKCHISDLGLDRKTTENFIIIFLDDMGTEYAKLKPPGSLHKVHLPHFDNFIQHTHGHLKSQPYSALYPATTNSNSSSREWNPSYV